MSTGTRAERLPRFGRMSEEYLRFVSQPMMADWMPDASWRERETAFNTWRANLRDLLAKTIWPYYDRERKEWVGRSKLEAEDATEAELKLMISELQEKDILRKKPRTRNPRASEHLWHFKVEDDLSKPLGINLGEYDPDASEQQLQFAVAVIGTVFEAKSNGLFWFKHQFLRPRAYQASMLLGLDRFQSRTARTALHPAFTSGHCVEGILGCAALAEAWHLGGGFPGPSSREALAQFAVDLGDRRVFAGVHYPSDNIGSWIVALNLVPHIFVEPTFVTDFVLTAIRSSAVYRLVDASFETHPALASERALLMEEMRKAEANTPTAGPDDEDATLAGRARARAAAGEAAHRSPGSGWSEEPVAPRPPPPRPR